MQSNKVNAVWASQTSTQTVGVNNWTQYQLSLTGNSYRFNINSAATTSTNLQYYTNEEGVNIAAGDSILLSTNGSTFASGTAGVVSYVGGASNILSSVITSGTGQSNTTMKKGPQYLSPDGRNFYILQDPTGGTVNYQIYQYALSTPFDISTLTYTGKTSFNIYDGTGLGPGFTFKTDGTILYISLFTNNPSETLTAYALGTAWDISTASSIAIGSKVLTRPQNNNSTWSANTGYGFCAFSPDGTKFIGCNMISAYQTAMSTGRIGNFAIYDLSVPWVINTCSTTTTNYTNTSQAIFETGNAQAGGFFFTPDGNKIITFAKSDVSTLCRINVIPTLGAYQLGNGTTSLTINSRTSTLFSSVSNPAIQGYFSANGSTFNVNQSNFGSSGRLISSDNDLYGKYNVNISSFSLAAAPTFAYNSAPTVYVDAETTAPRVNLFPYEVYQASSTTSQAVIYKPTSGYLQAGDTILLNGTTSVALTSVTQGANLGVAAVPITTVANRTYANKTLTLMSTGQDYNFRISPDGGTMIAGLRYGSYGAGLYQYTLTTPFDINTATFANRFAAVTGDGITLTGSSGTVAFDVSPDGLRLITLGCFLTGSTTSAAQLTAREYLMSQPWDIGTLRPSGVTWNSNINSATPNSATCIRFVPNGSQFVWIYNNYASSTSSYMYYVACGTAYQIGTAGGGPGILWASTSSSGGDVRSVTFTPDGLNIITNGIITTTNTLGTANNMATATLTNTPNTATTKWAWPSGTYGGGSSYAWGSHFSPDGTKFYIINGSTSGAGNNNIYQMNVMVIPQTSYTCNFATQASAPTSIVIPDRSVQQTITTTLAGGNMTFAAPTVSTNARGIATKIIAPGNFTTVSNATLNMWRS